MTDFERKIEAMIRDYLYGEHVAIDRDHGIECDCGRVVFSTDKLAIHIADDLSDPKHWQLKP